MGKILERIVALERPSGLYHRRAASPRSLVLIESLAFTPFLTSISLPIGARWRTERPNLTNLPLTQSSAGPAAPALAQCTADVNGFMEVEVNAPSTPMRGDSGGVRTPDGNSYFAVYLNQPPDPCAIVTQGRWKEPQWFQHRRNLRFWISLLHRTHPNVFVKWKTLMLAISKTMVQPRMFAIGPFLYFPNRSPRFITSNKNTAHTGSIRPLAA